MKLAGWLGIGSLTSAGLLAAIPRTDFALEVWLGMLGPAVAVIVAWLVIERTFRKNPEQLTGVQARLFFAKMLFFGVYVAAVLGAELTQPYAFMTTFAAYFILLYGIHAVALHRLITVHSGECIRENAPESAQENSLKDPLEDPITKATSPGPRIGRI